MSMEPFCQYEWIVRHLTARVAYNMHKHNRLISQEHGAFWHNQSY